MADSVKARLIILLLLVVVVVLNGVSLASTGWVKYGMTLEMSVQVPNQPSVPVSIIYTLGMGLWGISMCFKVVNQMMGSAQATTICMYLSYFAFENNGNTNSAMGGQSNGNAPEIPGLGESFKDGNTMFVLMRLCAIVSTLCVILGSIMALLYFCHRGSSGARKRCYFISCTLFWTFSASCFILTTLLQIGFMSSFDADFKKQFTSMMNSTQLPPNVMASMPQLKETKMLFPWVIVINVLTVVFNFILVCGICIVRRRGIPEKDYVKYIRVEDGVDADERDKCQIAFKDEPHALEPFSK